MKCELKLCKKMFISYIKEDYMNIIFRTIIAGIIIEFLTYMFIPENTIFLILNILIGLSLISLYYLIHKICSNPELLEKSLVKLNRDN